MTTDEIYFARFEWLRAMSRYGAEGADAAEREAIRQATGHVWTAGMVRNEDDPRNSHLAEWTDYRTKDRLRLTPIGMWWALSADLAAEEGVVDPWDWVESHVEASRLVGDRRSPQLPMR